MSAKAMVVAMDVAANVFTVALPPDVQAVEVEGVAAVIVRADNSIDLFMLTFDPLSPVALVNMQIVPVLRGGSAENCGSSCSK